LRARGGGSHRTSAGTQSAGLSAGEAAAYADSTYATMLRRGLDPKELSGARVLEVGPGDNLGLAVRLVAGGADRVDAVDRFEVESSPEHQRATYTALIARLRGEERERAQAALGEGDELLDPRRVRLHAGLPIERATERFAPGRFDIVVSVAALQHVRDAEAALRALDRLVRPGGLMMHQLDLSDLGTFSGHGLHPLTFLTFPDRLYGLMSSSLGAANRGLLPHYRDPLEGLGYEVSLFITRIAGGSRTLDPPRSRLERGRDFGPADERRVDTIRPRLGRRYRDLPVEDLLADAALLVARKPERSTVGGRGPAVTGATPR
jgi:SAM-dependent methyltransferase